MTPNLATQELLLQFLSVCAQVYRMVELCNPNNPMFFCFSNLMVFCLENDVIRLTARLKFYLMA